MSKLGSVFSFLGVVSLFILVIGLPVFLVLALFPVYEDPHVETIQDIRYFKDSRTGLCYATLSRRIGRGLAEVPCDQIPKDLLEVPALGKKNGGKGGSQ